MAGYYNCGQGYGFSWAYVMDPKRTSEELAFIAKKYREWVVAIFRGLQNGLIVVYESFNGIDFYCDRATLNYFKKQNA